MLLETSVHWPSEETVRLEVTLGFARNLQKYNSHFTQKLCQAAMLSSNLLHNVNVAMAKIACPPSVQSLRTETFPFLIISELGHG